MITDQRLTGESSMFDIEQSVGFALAKAHQRFSAVLKEELKDHCITPRQFILLAMLWKTDGLTQIELSKKSDIDRTTLVGIIDRLEKAELLERKPSPEDRRAHLIRLTDKGRCLEQRLAGTVSRIRDRIEKRIVPEEYRQLNQLLNKLGYRQDDQVIT
jgi:DNA-binding MarR family transcriptional regulator